MNSHLYRCTIVHKRTSPKKHSFNYPLFMFYLDLDELDLINSTHRLVSRNRFSPYEFRDSDHYQNNEAPVKESILSYLNEQSVNVEIGKIFLLTHLRTFGHVFNPVSFYFVFDKQGKSICSIAEVANTFNEQKMFIIPSSERESRQNKNFYVSPFSDLDTVFHFKLRAPNEHLRLAINQSQKQNTYFRSALVGKRQPLKDYTLALYALRFPLITVSIIAAIHWQAFLLFCKGIPVRRKNENSHQQTNTRPYIINKKRPIH